MEASLRLVNVDARDASSCSTLLQRGASARKFFAGSTAIRRPRAAFARRCAPGLLGSNRESKCGTPAQEDGTMTRSEALQSLATEARFAQLTAGQALQALTHAYQVALDKRDLAFFEFHAEDPCHEVARACLGGHVWRGDENNPQRAKPHWRQLEKEVVPEVVRKN
jgi:hypothetical protein